MTFIYLASFHKQMAEHLQTGKVGEEIARNYLIQEGYEILELNWRFSRAEVDIIAKKNKALIFVEVKTRKTDHFGAPEVFVNQKKEDFLKQAGMQYMAQIGHEWEFRFDIIAVLFKAPENYQIKHIEDAFY